MTTPDLAGLCERLRAPSNWLMQPRGKDWKSVVNQYDRAPFEAAAAIERLVAENERMREALKPFAAEHECDGHATVEDFNMEVQIFVRWTTIKAARTALEGASDDR